MFIYWATVHAVKLVTAYLPSNNSVVRPWCVRRASVVCALFLALRPLLPSGAQSVHAGALEWEGQFGPNNFAVRALVWSLSLR